jgi:hypothetical protein
VENDTLRLAVAAAVERTLRATERHVLRAGFLTLRFIRGNSGVNGLLVDAGRVKNLVFAKR